MKHIMIVATPLNLPALVPDDWSVFWNIWNNYGKPIVKTQQNHKGSYSKIGDTDVWKGLDIYKNNLFRSAWTAPYYDIREELPLMYQMVTKNPVLSLVTGVRVVESLGTIPPHTDDNIDRWNVRAMLHYTDPNPQWFFTKPNDMKNISFLTLPASTNWFAYNDKHTWHGSKYNPDHPKLLIQFFGVGFKGNQFLEKSAEMYKEYTISYD